MYTSFYGLRELPFELSPNPKYLLLTARHREALANLQYGIASRKSLTLLLGEAGTGKTTLVNAALSSGPCRAAQVVHLANPALTRAEFVEFLARRFGLSEDARQSKTAMLTELERLLLERRATGITTALVIDEAQALSHELLEEVRLLANIETPEEKLLPVVLAGQPELADRLNHVSLRQLKQRVALRCMLGLLDLVETAAYIEARIRIAGGGGQAIFTPEAVETIHVRSGGVPRTISVICDNALVNGFAAGLPTIDAALVREVCSDFDFGPANGRVPPGGTTQGVTSPKFDRSPAPAAPARPAEPAAAARGSDDQALFSSFGRKKRFTFF